MSQTQNESKEKTLPAPPGYERRFIATAITGTAWHAGTAYLARKLLVTLHSGGQLHLSDKATKVSLWLLMPVSLVVGSFLSLFIAKLRGFPQWTTFPYLGFGYLNFGRPPFLTRDQHPALAKAITEHYPEILAEVDAYKQDHAQVKMIPSWRMVYLNEKLPEIRENFPETIAALHSTPGLFTEGRFMKLKDGNVPPHCGHSDCYVRCHLGLHVPAGPQELAINVGGEPRGWKEGECLVFNDALYHWAFSRVKEDRVILMFDILRPQFEPRRNHCENVMADLSALNRSMFSYPIFAPFALILYVWRSSFANATGI